MDNCYLYADIFDLFIDYLTYKEYFPILVSCKELYTWEYYMNCYKMDIVVDMNYAAINGYLTLLQYFHKVDNVPLSIALYLSASNGHLDIVKYTYIIDKSYAPSALNVAATNGHMHIVEYLRDK